MDPLHPAFDRLDTALVAVRRILHAPEYRRRILEGVGADLPLSTLRALRAVERASAEEPPTIGQVAELLGLDPSTVSRAIDDAGARGLLERQSCDRDRRRQRLSLTPAGLALLDRATAVRRAILAEVTDGWDAEELTELVDRLERLVGDFARLRVLA